MFSDNTDLICDDKWLGCSVMLYHSNHTWFERVLFRRQINDMIKIWLFSDKLEELDKIEKKTLHKTIELEIDNNDRFFITCEQSVAEQLFEGYRLTLVCLGKLGKICHSEKYTDYLMVAKAYTSNGKHCNV